MKENNKAQKKTNNKSNNNSPVNRALPTKKKRNIPFPIIGMGGSAGSFKALESFFTRMPVDSGMAFIIIMHLDPNHKGSIAGLVQTYTGMPVMQAEDGMVVEPDHVYVIPPNKDMGIHNRKLLLLTPTKNRGQQMPVDYFLQSLAEDQWNYAVAVILSGMGTDGETGVRMIKEKLGMAMVQDPESAEYQSMPKSSLSTGMVDYVLPPEEMPVNMIQYLSHPALSDDLRDEAISETRTNNILQKILMLLRSHTGHDFTLYKKNTITRRIDRRIAFYQLPDYVHYINYLRENPHEIDLLFNELLIGVTKFFRDAPAFEALRERLEEVLKQKRDEEPVRIWVAGCSTGEEAYSVAMIVTEIMEKIKSGRGTRAQIFATDLDDNAIEHARLGNYYDNIVSDVSPDRLERFFVKKNDCYSVKKELREMIVFAQHNLIKDAPFTRLDLLCCRNVMIYLTTELQKKIIPIFHYSLNHRGLLFLGPAETVGVFGDMFNPLEVKWKISERKEGISTVGKMIDFPFNVTYQNNALLKPDVSKPGKKTVVSEIFNKLLLENYTPASVLLNEKGDILYINGRTGKYLELISGEALMNIHRMAREEIRYALGNAIHQVLSSRSQVYLPEIKLKDDQQIRLVNITVNYLEDLPVQGLVLVLFEDKGLFKKPKRSAKQSQQVTGDMVEELEKELMYTKQQLHTTIEQMETSLEELKSTNEELQSTNEELQSTNEESLTTKEEMQSLNEELMTINLQYQIKGEELTQLNNDMKNLLDSTETGTIFLDTKLNILRYTPQVKKLFNVIPSDIGRSITHVVSNFEYPAIENDIFEVIERLAGKELEVRVRNGDWYNLRIMPYRTLDNFISGAVLTFNRITPLKAMENQLKTLQKFADNTLGDFSFPALILDADMNILAANKPFSQQFSFRDHEIKDQSFIELAHNKWNTTKLDKLFEQGKKQISELTLQHDFPGLGLKTFYVGAQPYLDDNSGKAEMILLTLKDGKEI